MIDWCLNCFIDLLFACADGIFINSFPSSLTKGALLNRLNCLPFFLLIVLFRNNSYIIFIAIFLCVRISIHFIHSRMWLRSNYCNSIWIVNHNKKICSSIYLPVLISTAYTTYKNSKFLWKMLILHKLIKIYFNRLILKQQHWEGN